MRLPRYARGLVLLRIAMYLMIAQLALAVIVMVKALALSETAGEWIKYFYWANVGASVLVVAAGALAYLDCRATGQATTRLAVAVVVGLITLACWLWSYRLLGVVLDLGNVGAGDDYDYEALRTQIVRAEEATSTLTWVLLLKDLVYPIALIAIVGSIRDVAQAHEHWPLRDAANRISSLTVGMALLDIFNQALTHYMPLGILALLGGVAAIAILLYWIYTHLRLAKFFKAAAVLMHNHDNLPVARVIVKDKPERAAPEPPPRPSAPAVPSVKTPVVPVDARPSQPIVVVAAELRPVHVPRAETSPGAPPSDEPKLLR